jgi:hypothetical protein
MFGSQAVSDRLSSQAFGFGSSTRDQMLRTYISPAHLKDLYGKYSPDQKEWESLLLRMFRGLAPSPATPATEK